MPSVVDAVAQLVDVAQEEPVHPRPVHLVLAALQGGIVGAEPIERTVVVVDLALTIAKRL